MRGQGEARLGLHVLTGTGVVPGSGEPGQLTDDVVERVFDVVTRAGQAVTFVAERDVVVAVTACPAAKANGGRLLPLGVEIGAG